MDTKTDTGAPPAPDLSDARLLQLLADICRAAFHVGDASQVDEHTPAGTICRVARDDLARLDAALTEADEVPEPDDRLEREGWLRVIETLRRRLAPVTRPLAQDEALRQAAQDHIDSLDNYADGDLVPISRTRGTAAALRAALAAAAPSSADPWQPIEAAPKDPRTRVLLKWVSGQSVWICIGAWDAVENRPSLKTKGCPREGWLPDGGACIPVNQKDCVSFMPLPAAPGAQPAHSEPERCPYCDNSGDVHNKVGEWLGECKDCAAEVRGEVPAEPSAIADRICNEVAELGDRNSPEDWPEAMLVTHAELHAIVVDALADQPTGATENRIDHLETELAQARAAVPAAWRVYASFWRYFDSIPEGLRGEAVPLYENPVAPEAVTPGEPTAAEEVRMAYKTGYDEGYSDASGGDVDHDACEEGWQQYLAAIAAAQAPENPT